MKITQGSPQFSPALHVQYLLLRASLGPELEQALDDLLGEGGVFLEELHYAVGELGVVEGQAAHLVKRDEYLDQELLVLCFQRQREPVYDAAENLQKLANPVKVLGLINESEKRKGLPNHIEDLHCSYFKKKLLICLRMNARSPRNLP